MSIPNSKFFLANFWRHTTCDKKNERKDELEDIVVKTTLERALTDENIELIASETMRLVNEAFKDKSVLTGLKAELTDTENKIKNLLKAIEQGIITDSTKSRMEELEQNRKDLEGRIAKEEIKKPFLNHDRIVYWLSSFKNGDFTDSNYRRVLIDTLVNSVYVYDEPKGRKTAIIKGSDLTHCTALKGANPNSMFLCKHCFGITLK